MPRQNELTERERAAIGRLIKIAQRDTGQSRKVANFLLAWHNADKNGGWDPTELWSVDQAIADDMLTVVTLIRKGPCGKYPGDWGFKAQIEGIWERWRGGRPAGAGV